MGKKARSHRITKRRQSRVSYSIKGGKNKTVFDEYYSENIEAQDRDFYILCNRYNYKSRFSEDLLSHACQLKAEFEEQICHPDFLQSDICRDRVNLTEETVFTVDGNDAKDFDDAISLDKVGENYHLGVHIADVSYFVKKNSPLDKEAFRRSNSVYLIDKVIPMFPEPISNHLCSLIEGEYRLTYSCFAEINSYGEVVDYAFKRSVIKSARRCTYREVEDVIHKRKSLSPEIDKSLLLMSHLKTILRDRRMAKGSIEFTTQEQSFSLVSGKVKAVTLKQPLSSENLIEEFMLTANVCAAKDLKRYGTGIYRVHDLPKSEKLVSFEKTVIQMGYDMPKEGTLNPLREKGVNRYVVFLDSIEDSHVRNNFSFLLLTSMSQAEYNVNNIGHYGLAFKHYTHFTSPIRRYSDLVVHRLLDNFHNKNFLPTSTSKKRSSKTFKELKENLKKVAMRCSENERGAVNAEREYAKVKSMRFLQGQEQKMEAMVMKVKENGMFIKILDSGIEGFISIYELEPDLFFDPMHEVYKRKGDVIYQLGTQLVVKLLSLNFKKLFIDFKPM